MPAATETEIQTQAIEMVRDKECKGSVRFNVPKPLEDTVAVTNVYISRKTPGIDSARSILVHVEIQ